MLDMDYIYSLLGNPGRYHLGIYALLSLNYVTVVVNHLAMAIYGIKVKIQCGGIMNSSIEASEQFCDTYHKSTKFQNLSDDNLLAMGNYSQLPNCSNWQYAVPSNQRFLRSEVVHHYGFML